MPSTRTPSRRSVASVGVWWAGLVLLSCGIAAVIVAGVGVGPLDVVTTALVRGTALSIGVAIFLLNVAMALATRALGARVRIATVLTALALGPMVDLAIGLLDGAELFEGTGELGRGGPWPWIGLAVGIVLIGAGGALQITSGWGPSPLDALAVAIVDATSWSMRRVRTALEVSFVVVGGLAGGALGAGTLLLAVGVGPVVASVLGRLEPLHDLLRAPQPPP
jgi:uncharacterized membrane protein YczE